MDSHQRRLDELNGSLLEAMLQADAGVNREAAIEAVRSCSARLDAMLASGPESHVLLHHSYIARSLRRDCDAELACLATRVRGTRGRFRHIIGQMEVLESCLEPSHRKTGDYSWPVAEAPLAGAAGIVSLAAIAGACRDVEDDVIGSDPAIEDTDPVSDETSPLTEATEPVPEDTNPLADAPEPTPESAEPTNPAPDSPDSPDTVPEPTDHTAEPADETCDTYSVSSYADSARSLGAETVHGDEVSTAPTSPTNSHSGVMEAKEGGPENQPNKSEETLARGRAREGSPRSSAEHGRPRQLSLASAPDSGFADKIFDDNDDANKDADRVGDIGSPFCSGRSVVSSDQHSERSKEKADDNSNADSPPAPAPAFAKSSSALALADTASVASSSRTRVGAAVEAFDSLISRTKKALGSPKPKGDAVRAERPKSFRGMAKKLMHIGKA
ncbi:hypothetical protein RB595_002572 [Gaeumannomyces hyphopodioides]